MPDLIYSSSSSSIFCISRFVKGNNEDIFLWLPPKYLTLHIFHLDISGIDSNIDLYPLLSSHTNNPKNINYVFSIPF